MTAVVVQVLPASSVKWTGSAVSVMNAFDQQRASDRASPVPTSSGLVGHSTAVRQGVVTLQVLFSVKVATTLPLVDVEGL
jgi:hypothetical protein